MRLSKFITCLLLSSVVTQLALAETVAVTTANGAQLAVIADFPPGEGKYPAIVLAPGQGYHMSLPAMEATARALTEQGIAVFRFNWAYFTALPQGQPSGDLSKELQDFQAVLAAARRHPKVVAQNLSVGGKSLGSLVAWRAFAADLQLRSALLLTPVCSRVPKGETSPRSEAKQNYPGLEEETRLTLLIVGDRDPLCAPSVLYAHLAASDGPVARVARLAIVGGDHGYEDGRLPGAAAQAALKRNLAALSSLSASFVAEAASAAP